MNKWSLVFLCVTWLYECSGREPLTPTTKDIIPFAVYFSSYYRGLCVGTMVSRTAVLTAAVCVTNPTPGLVDRRPVNVVLGSHYRHSLRGIRVQVTKILVPNLSDSTGSRGYLMEKSPAVLILRRKIPDVLTETLVRAAPIDWEGEDALALSLQDQCIMPGWHFFYKNDQVYPVMRFMLQRNLRVQMLHIVRKSVYCETLLLKLQQALTNLGYRGLVDREGILCVHDPDKMAQPCHGMYGAPLMCKGKVVGVMTSPDAQWTNCTGFSNVVHMVSASWIRPYMACVSRLFEVEPNSIKSWSYIKKGLYKHLSGEEYDYLHTLYDDLYSETVSTEED